jgi:uncharacterized membrane protein YfcA
MVPVPLLALSALAVFVSGTVQGATGFGFVILAAPILTAYLAPTLVVPVMVMQSLVLGFVLVVHSYRWVRIGRIWPLMLAGVAFTPLGTLALVRLDEGVLKLLMGLVVGTTAIAMLLGWQRPVSSERAASVPVGALSGLLTGSTGLSGAPVILFFANQGIDPREFRANIVLYLQTVGLLALPSFLIGGVLTAEALTLAAQLLPASLAGVFTGIWLSHRVSLALFRRLALFVVVIAGVGAAASGVVGR